ELEGTPLPRPAGGEVRVPITAPPRRPAEQQQQQQPEEEEEEEDAGSGPVGSPCRDPPADLASEEEEQVPYPALAPTAFFCLKQTTRPRSWCLRLRVGVGLGKAHASLASGPENSPLLLFFCNLQAGKEEDSQASKSHPPPLCPLPALLVLSEEEQCVPLSCDIQKIEFYPKCLCASKQRVVSLS
uniref:Uncharacterized protein n=1 Tax=Accipiter nisus TaxID=211598 RepID=A0A8B9RR16_9AVES